MNMTIYKLTTMLSNGKVDGVYMRTKQMLNQKTNIRYNSDHCGKDNIIVITDQCKWNSTGVSV